MKKPVKRDKQQQWEKLYYRRMRRKYPEVRGKVVDYITEERGDDGFFIRVEFTDKTSITWDVRPKVVLEPVMMNWKTGNGKTVRTYPSLATRGYCES